MFEFSQKRKGSGFWSMYWCFGSHKNNKRIGHALFLSESGRSEQPAALASESLNSEGRLVVLPFVAPPSSPTSFDPSEPPSATLSPVNMFSASSGMYSPSGPTNIFAIGPYANEPQLVSPPVFSTFTTEPSTAPVTPPPEYVHLTTPSSPEVPFARLLDPTNNNSEVSRAFPLSQYEFQSYQYYPGSPVGQLISPCSGISSSGTSSPFEHVVGSRSLQFPSTGRPKFLILDKKPARDWGSRTGSGSLTPDSAGPRKAPARDWGSRIGSGSVTPDSTGHWKPGKDWGSRIGSGSLTPDTASRRSRESCILDLQNYIISHAPNMGKSAPKFESLEGQGLGHGPNAEPVVDHRVSFELSAMDVLKCVEKKQAAWTPSPFPDASSSTPGENLNPATTSEEQQTAQRRSIFALGSGKEFNFDNIVVGSSSRRSDVLSVGSDWWANEKIVAEDGEACEGWPFFSAAHSTSTAR
uniref:Hydroxyproline-rich glycoprotein family protein n=1 Tax=Kalanchoe fedtschenkoi TaxID=63787 RepID=A0A7N0U2S5_KALFE